MAFNNQQPIEEEEEEELTILDSQHVCDSIIVFFFNQIHFSTAEFQLKLRLPLGLINLQSVACRGDHVTTMLMVFNVSAAAGQEASGSSDRPAEPQTAENQPGAD